MVARGAPNPLSGLPAMKVRCFPFVRALLLTCSILLFVLQYHSECRNNRMPPIPSWVPEEFANLIRVLVFALSPRVVTHIPLVCARTQRCWAFDPEKRPSFPQIVEELKELLAAKAEEGNKLKVLVQSSSPG